MAAEPSLLQAEPPTDLLPCLQAAAERAFPAFHPALLAASVRVYAKKQQHVRANIASGAVTTRMLPSPEGQQWAGHMSPDFSRTALLSATDHSTVHIHEVSTGALQHIWRLPKEPTTRSTSIVFGWDAPSQYLVVPFESRANGNSGLMFLAVDTGACTTVDLSRTEFVDSPLAFCPRHSLVLAQHDLPQFEDNSSTLSVFDCQGTLLRRIEAPPGVHTHSTSWAPSGQAALLYQMGEEYSSDSDVEGYRLPPMYGWLWILSEDTPVRLDAPDAAWAAWATPGEARLLVGAHSPDEAFVASLEEEQDLELVVGDKAEGYLCHAVWGSRVVMQFFERMGAGAPALELCSEQDGQLVLQASISAAPRMFSHHALHVSADGQHVAALTATALDVGSGRHDWQHSQPHLAIAHVASGTLQQFPLQGPLAATARLHRLHVSWNLDCTAVLVSAYDGTVYRPVVSQLFSFA